MYFTLCKYIKLHTTHFSTMSISDTDVDMNLSITDGTFIDLLKSSGTYTAGRQQLYEQWQALYAEYTQLEYRVLLKICHA
jgi:hypothetical protein